MATDLYRQHAQKWLSFAPVRLSPILIEQRLQDFSAETEWPNPHLEPAVASNLKASAARSGVAIIFREDAGLSLVLTRRSQTIRFGGQWCFPGGRESVRDGSLRDAARRETEEEIGLKADALLWLGCLGHYYTQSGFLIECHVFNADRLCPFQLNGEEVSELAEVPLSALQNTGNYHLIARGQGRANFQFRWQSVQVGGPTVSLLIHLMRVLSGATVPHGHIASHDRP